MKNENTQVPSSPEAPNEQEGIRTEEGGCCCGGNGGGCQNDRCQCAEQEAAEVGTDQKLAELQDKHLRLAAEFDNFRRRNARERLDMLVFAGEDIIKGLLPVIDDFERAIKSAEAAPDGASMFEGIKLIYQKTLDYLKSKGLQEIDPALTDFSTDFHDAVTKFPASAAEQKGKIIETIQKGYKLNDKVIRFAKVVVGE